MSIEIDDYLFEKIKYVVDGAGDETLKLSKIRHLDKDFKELKSWLESPVSPSSSLISEADWPKIRREKLYYLNNLLTEWQSITKKWGMYTPESLSSAYHLSKKLSKLRKDLKGGDGTGSTHVPYRRDEPQDEDEESSKKISETTYRWSCRFVDPAKVHGLETKAMSLERALVGTGREAGDSFKAIGIVGMPGIGKTTLAQLIFGRSKVKDYFLPRIWVSMSKQPDQDTIDTKEIVERILRSLGIEEEVIMKTYKLRKLEGLIFTLRVQLMDKRYLIVLDDVEEDFGKSEVQNQLEYGLPKGCGGTVIVTSRNQKVAKGMVGEENLHTVVPLTDPDSCWLIFKDWVEKDKTDFPMNLVGFRDEIVRKCGGLPLSAKLMGQIVNRRLNQLRQTRQPQRENQQPPTENQQPPTENQQPPTEQLPMENQQQRDQPLTKNYQPMEEQQPIEKLQMENQQLTELPQMETETENQQLTELPQTETENQQLTEQPENQELTEQSENQELTEQQPENQELTELPENQELTEQQLANQELTEQPENQELTEQPENQELTELGTENWQLIEKPQPENDQPTEEPKMENQQQEKREEQRTTE